MEACAGRGASIGRAVGVVVAVLLLAGVFASSALANTYPITAAPPSPTFVGTQVTFSTQAGGECPPTYTWTIDGQAQTPQVTGTDLNPNEIKWTFSTPGDHTVSVKVVQCSDNLTEIDSTTYTALAPLQGSIAVSPDPPVVNQPANLSATQSGGDGNYSYAWDFNGGSTFGDSTSRTPTTTFTSIGPHTVKVKITDDKGNFLVVSRTLNVQQPSTTTTTTTTTTPCVSEIHFQLSQFKTPGCFTQIGGTPAKYTTTSSVTLNGITFPDFGQTFTITAPSAQDPGGHFTAPGSVIRIGSVKVFSGNVDWSLPTGSQGGEAALKTFSVATGAQLFGLSLAGSVSLNLGWDDPKLGGLHYASFGLNMQLPAGFSAGPDPSFGSVTGAASLRVDDAGVHYNGLQVGADNVWIGKLKVDHVCFSYIPAGGQTISACAPPSLDGTPYLTCNTDVTANRWDGNAVIELPGSGITLAAFGGLSNGAVSSFGGFVDGLGRKAPLAPNVFLNRIGVGLCLNPPPFTLRGDVGISIFPTTGDESLATINGHVIYTNSYPWTLEIGGSVNVLDREVGSGSVLINGWGDFAFDLNASVDLYGIASISGDINGWVDPPSKQYAVSGSVNACVNVLGCVMGSGVVSSTGVAGCITITSTHTSPDLIITLGSPPTVSFAKTTISINAGFGYVWGASAPDVFANSCDLSGYQPTRPFARDSRAGVIAERVASGTTAMAWRIHGSHGVPKVLIHGPHGTVISSSAHRAGAQRKGHWMLVENPRNGTTNVLFIHPAAGTWTVQALAGTTSIPTKIDQAKFQAPPTLAAGVRSNGTSRTLQMAYAVPRGATVRLIEHGKGVNRTLVRSVHGHHCAGAPVNRPGSDEKVLCFNLRFRPAPGPAGLRKIQALVSKGGVPIVQKDIASFRAPKLTLPTRPRLLLARRVGGGLRVAFTRSSGALRYVVSAKLSDGRKLAFDLRANCQAVQIAGVSRLVGATVKIAGMRFDLALGKSRSISIKPRAKSVVPKGKLPKTLKSPRRICS